jgi:hypothetical protein
MIFYTVNPKFNIDARKAFFSELSTRLQYMSEDINENTNDEIFVEIIEIVNELRSQCVNVRVDNIMQKDQTNEVKF